MKIPFQRKAQQLIRKWAAGLPSQFFTSITRGDLAGPYSGSYRVTLTPNAYIYQFMGAGQNAVMAAGLRLIVAGIETVRFGVVPFNKEDAEPDYDHPIIERIRNPGPDQTRGDLIWTLTENILLAGNALIIPHPDGRLEVPDARYVRWPLPAAGPPRYTVRNPFAPGLVRSYAAEEVAHIRHHIAPDGYNGVGVVTLDILSEIGTDQAAQSYTATLLTRMGVPGMIITPGDETDDYTDEDADKMRRAGEDMFSASGVGTWLATAKRWEFQEPKGATASRLDLSKIRNVSEERLLAALGVPPSLLGIGTGAQQTRVGATMATHRRQFAQGTLQPLAHLLADQMTTHLLPFVSPPGRFRIVPDFSDCIPVREAEAQAELERLEIAERAVNSGIMTAEQAAVYMGWEEQSSRTGPPPPDPQTAQRTSPLE